MIVRHQPKHWVSVSPTELLTSCEGSNDSFNFFNKPHNNLGWVPLCAAQNCSFIDWNYRLTEFRWTPLYLANVNQTCHSSIRRLCRHPVLKCLHKTDQKCLECFLCLFLPWQQTKLVAIYLCSQKWTKCTHWDVVSNTFTNNKGNKNWQVCKVRWRAMIRAAKNKKDIWTGTLCSKPVKLYIPGPMPPGSLATKTQPGLLHHHSCRHFDNSINFQVLQQWSSSATWNRRGR